MKSKFQSIYQQLVKEIGAGRYVAGETLPSEHELTVAFNASRETIRKALNLLSEHGYIQKIQGKGSVVLDVGRLDFPVSGVTSFQELNQALGIQAETEVIYFEELSADQDMATKLEISEGEPVFSVARVRTIDGERIILDKDLFSGASIPGLTKEQSKGSIYRFIEEDLGLSISFAKKEIVVETASAEDVASLDVEQGHYIVVVRSFTYLDDATLFQYSESRHRPDRFRFVDFARRNKI
ncbi:GntR family trehalose operon transcriptional repressor [Alkalihalobacillus xiaoxiensis]|uniref:Trehalose operon repressor n=1 Tax=Shouchella xiaoxiensis TaxID=766895 RepID=A0ABS2SQC5_9BACI|nr:GntR family trehalose operon transcriptional repressor [Shouchella xiaoxiensis]